MTKEKKTAKDAATSTAAPAALPEKRRRRKGASRRRARSGSRPPEKVLRLTTYERLGEYLQAFAQGHFHLMILVGTGGLAKSRLVRAVLGDKACWIEGNATPFGMYAKFYRHKDEFVVIDDVDALYADRSGVRLLKGVTEGKLRRGAIELETCLHRFPLCVLDPAVSGTKGLSACRFRAHHSRKLPVLTFLGNHRNHRVEVRRPLDKHVESFPA